MKDVNNIRSRKFFSGRQAKDYPQVGPTGDQYKIYQDALHEMCSSRKEKIAILELGCGTGRYFHFLSNANKLVGVDISPDMLLKAKENLKTMPALESITTLVQSSIEDFTPDSTFDFIYSIGTLAEYCEFNEQLFSKIISYLKPGGYFFFTLVDLESFDSNEYIWPRKKIMRAFLKFLPKSIRNKVDAKWLTYADWKHLFLKREQVENILKSTKASINWELSKAKDSLHTHHICKVWLK
jgi:SAM-dependent methyltransferase